MLDNGLRIHGIKTLIINDNALAIFIRTVSKPRADISPSTKCVTFLLMLGLM